MDRDGGGDALFWVREESEDQAVFGWVRERKFGWAGSCLDHIRIGATD